MARSCPICGVVTFDVWEHVEWHHPLALSHCPVPGCSRQIKSGTAEGLIAHVQDVHNWPSSVPQFVAAQYRPPPPGFAPVSFGDSWGVALPAEPPVSLTCCKRKKKGPFKSATALAHHVIDVHASESCLRAVHKKVAGGLRGAIAQSGAQIAEIEESPAASVASTAGDVPTAPPASVLSTSSMDDTLARLDRLENEAAVRCALLQSRSALSDDIHREYRHLHEDTDGAVVAAVKETLEQLCPKPCSVVVSGSRVMRTAIQGSDVDLVVDCGTCAARDAAAAAIFRCGDFSISGAFEKGGAKIITFLYKGKTKFDVSVSAGAAGGSAISVAVTQAEIDWFALQRASKTHVEKVVVYLKGWKELTPNKACGVLKGASLTCLAVRCMEVTSSLMDAVKEAFRQLIACQPIKALYMPCDNLTAHIKAAEWAGIIECAERQLKHLYVLERGTHTHTHFCAGKPRCSDARPHNCFSIVCFFFGTPVV